MSRTDVVNPMGAGSAGKDVAKPASEDVVSRLRSMALRGLARMYRPDERLFVFRIKRAADRIVPLGLSRRYTAIALIGLAGEREGAPSAVLAGHDPKDVCGRLMADVGCMRNLGDVALILWAACALGYEERRWAWDLLAKICAAERVHSAVEVAWALTALCVDSDPSGDELREHLAGQLMASFSAHSGIFPHVIGTNGVGLRAQVSCFADLVYPIHALAHYTKLTGSRLALDTASRCADQICRLQGPAGQWWWHYDRRTGHIIEPYPVYAVHQDGMAPMALFALQEASGKDFTTEIAKGLAWLVRSPELGGRSLIDDNADCIWRKVARREPRKLSRYIQAIASRVHPALRAPGLDWVFPPRVVDYEDRPYHLGWLLYAWSPERVSSWSRRGAVA